MRKTGLPMSIADDSSMSYTKHVEMRSHEPGHVFSHGDVDVTDGRPSGFP